MSTQYSNLTGIQTAYSNYVLGTYGRFPLCLVEGRGARVKDIEGREYLDFGAGIAVASLGHCHERLVAAIQQQAGTLIHTSNLYYTLPQVKLAEKLVEAVGSPGKIFFTNSGAESNELAYKLAQRFGLKTGGDKNEIVTFQNSFHGRTLGGLSATAQDKIKEGFGPLVPGFRHLPFNDVQALRAGIDERTSAILLEPIQGESGINPASEEFLNAAAQLCRENNALLMLDEIQCGLGRTGHYCGWKSLGAEDVQPDVITWAKGIAGGMPLGAVWISDRKITLEDGSTLPLSGLLTPGSHGTTYGGSPVGCAAGLAIFEEIEEKDLLTNVRERGAEIVDRLSKLDTPLIRLVRGQGLMLGIVLAEDFWDHIPADAATAEDRKGAPSRWLTLQLAGKGLLVVPAGTHVVRMLPPLNVTPAEADEALTIFSDYLHSIATK